MPPSAHTRRPHPHPLPPMLLTLALLAVWCLGAAAQPANPDTKAAPSVSSSQDLYYDREPKLRIRSSGFTGGDHQITLAFRPSLTEGKDYTLDLLNQGNGQVLMLKLLTGKRWANTAGKSAPVVLYLISAKDESLGGAEIIPEGTAIQVASIIPTPTVEESSQTIYQSATTSLTINGTFSAAKSAKLYFDPPLLVEIDYEVKAIRPTFITLILRHGAQWTEFPGPLYLKGIDTGAGALKVGGEEGVLVATVQADLDKHGVTVKSNDELKIYQNTHTLTISGEGFDPSTSGNTLRFANGLLGDGVNYTITAATSTSLTLTLSATSLWRKNGENLPGPLVLLAVDAGAGYVPVGATNAKKGRPVAKVYETPVVYSSNTKLFKTHSHELRLNGAGFPPSGLIIDFEPVLKVNEDYTLQVVDRTQVIVVLKDGRSWGAEGADLKVTAISSIGPESKLLLPNDGVHVAMIIADIQSSDTGGVTITPTSQAVYQTPLLNSIELKGTGFSEGISFTLDPPLTAGTDYTLAVKSDSLITLTLMDGKKWAESAGSLKVMSWTVEGKPHEAAGGAGIRIATVFADPKVQPGEGLLHLSQSKALSIYGSGFSDQDVTIELDTTPASYYKVSWVLDDVIRLLLADGKKWLDKAGDSKTPIKLLSIDTGAGKVTLPNGGTIVAYVIPDREGITCDDTCEFAFDGVCDDPSAALADKDWGSGYDDDYGGYDDYSKSKGEKGGDGGEYDDYYLDDQYTVSACLSGTDCTDCGGVDAMGEKPESDCANTCHYARDGTCDDPRGGNYCPLGSDCQDCGPVGAANFTVYEDDAWWDDEDDYWDFNDNNFLDQVKGIEHNRPKIKKRVQEMGDGGIFISLLEGIVYSTGAVIAVFGAWMGYRYYNGERVPFLEAFTPNNMDERSTRRAYVTPDVLRT